MTKLVIKNGVSKVPFDSKKIIRSITKASQDANFSTTEINKLVNRVSDIAIQYANTRDKISTCEIKDKILYELDLSDPKVSFEWRKFMNTKNM